MPNTSSATPSLDLATNPNPTGWRKCKLKEGASPIRARKGLVLAGEEFTADAKHAKELLEVGAVDILGDADGPDLTEAERLHQASKEVSKAKAEDDLAKAKEAQEKPADEKPAPATPAA